jgi:transcriptional regulator with XRE-family HTH domain
MTRKSQPKFEPVRVGAETLGQRIARLRKERGLSQQQLAEETGLIQVVISDYEHDKLRLHAEVVIRLAKALEMGADDLLGLKPSKNNGSPVDLKLVRRLKKIESLRPSQQKALLQTIDNFIKGAGQPA